MEITVVSKAKQGYIYRYMVEHGMNQNELARELKLSPSMFGKILNFEWFPPKIRKKNGIADRLEEYFRVPTDYLFPSWLTDEIKKKLGKKIIQTENVEILQIQDVDMRELTYDQEEAEDEELLYYRLEKMLDTLTPREQKAIRLLRGIGVEKVLPDAQNNPWNQFKNKRR